MTNQDDHPMNSPELRKKAEKVAIGRVARTPESSADLSPEEMRQTIHELRLQQMALERQNQELRTAQVQTKAEEALAHSENLMRFVIEHTNSGVAIHDRNLNYLYVSQRYLDMYNVQEQEVLGKHHYEVFPDLPQKWRDVHQKALAGEVSGSDRDPYVREDGTVEYTRWECRPWYEADGSVGGIIVYTEVITALLQQEQSLREYAECLAKSEENLRITLRSIGDAVISTDVDGRVVAMNPVAESLTGWSEKEAFGQPLDEVFRIINEQTRQAIESPVTNVLKTGHIVGLANHTLLIAKDGKETPIADSGAPIRNVRGETTGVVLIFRDQSAEYAARSVLEKSEARLRRAQKVAQVGDWEFNLKTGTFNASDSAREIYGMSDCESSIEDVQKIPLPQYRPLLDAAMNDLIQEGKPYDVEFTIRGGSDQALVEIYSVAEYDTQTETVFGVIQDITERKQAQDLLKQQKTQLEQRNRALEQFNYAVSHELKTPLVTIETSLGLIQGTLPATMDPGLAKFFGYARSATRQMHHLLESLLLIFRIDTTDSELEAIEFRMLAQDVVDQLIKGDRLQNIKVTIAAEGPTLKGDRDKLVQIWQHLIDNAARYMGDQKHPAIDIGVEQTDQEMLFYVCDNGMGIEEQYQGRIFGLFDQLDKDTVGTGLGLTLVQRIVEYYGGTIWVKSGGTNQGSCFYFTLPDALI